MTTELLGFCSSWISDKQRPIVGNELLLQIQSTRGVDVFGMVGNDGLGDGLSQGVHLRGVSSPLYPQTDIDVSEVFLPGSKDGLVDLEPEDFRLEVGDWAAIDVNKTTALLGLGDGSRCLFIRPLCKFRLSKKTTETGRAFFFPKVCTAFVDILA